LNPSVAIFWAIPLPMLPAQTTAAFWIVMYGPFVIDFGRV